MFILIKLKDLSVLFFYLKYQLLLFPVSDLLDFFSRNNLVINVFFKIILHEITLLWQDHRRLTIDLLYWVNIYSTVTRLSITIQNFSWHITTTMSQKMSNSILSVLANNVIHCESYMNLIARSCLQRTFFKSNNKS